MLDSIHSFLVKETLAGKCSLERGGAAYYLHLQMVLRIQAFSVLAVSKLLKSYIGWDKERPAGGMVMCKPLANKGLHTFYGMLGYCMKDAGQDHFRTLDQNVAASDLELGLEQLALHGQEECKTRVMLTQRNFAQKCLTWRKWNYKHPAVPDWDKEFFLMLKSGKYYPCTSWVVGAYGRGYEPYRMQSLWRMLVSLTTIAPTDVTNVFCQPNQVATPTVSRKDWFLTRWGDAEPSGAQATCAIAGTVAAAVEKMDAITQQLELEKKQLAAEGSSRILVHTPMKQGPASAAEEARRRKGGTICGKERTLHRRNISLHGQGTTTDDGSSEEEAPAARKKKISQAIDTVDLDTFDTELETAPTKRRRQRSPAESERRQCSRKEKCREISTRSFVAEDLTTDGSSAEDEAETVNNNASKDKVETIHIEASDNEEKDHAADRSQQTTAAERKRKGKGVLECNPRRSLWSKEWEVEEYCTGHDSESDHSHRRRESVLKDVDFIPVYKRRKPAILIS